MIVQDNGYNIDYIDNPSEIVQLAAIEYSSDVIKFIKNPTAKVLKLAERKIIELVKNSPRSIEGVENPSEKIQLIAVKANPRAVHYIKNPSYKTLEYVAINAPRVLGYSSMDLDSYSEEIKFIAVSNWPDLIRLISNPSLTLQLAAKGSMDAQLSRPNFKVSNQHVTLEVIGKKLRIINNTKNFVKLKSIAEYFGENVNSVSIFNIPPETIITKTLWNSRKNTINSLSQNIQYGFAIEYQIANESKIYDFYKTKKYKVGDLIK